MTEQTSNSGGGLDPKVAGALAYLCGWLSGLIFLLIEKDNKTVRFHAWHSILINVAIIAYFFVTTILAFIPYVGIVIGLLNLVVWLGMIVLMIVNMVKAYKGERLNLPVISAQAEKLANG